MCNEYERFVTWRDYRAMLAGIDLGMPAEQTALDLPPSPSVRISDIAPVMHADGNVVKLVPMRWSFPASRPGGKPVFNYRSEGRSFRDSKRCLIPASAFFEFTGAKSPKSKYRFALAGQFFMAIAGLWRIASDGQPPTFTMLTTSPGPDLAPYHDRQVVELPPSSWASWLYLDRPESELLRALPAASLNVTLVRKAQD